MAARLVNSSACPDLVAVSTYDTKPVHILSMTTECVRWDRLCIPGEFLGIPLGFPFSASKKREFGFLRRRESIIYDVQTKRNEAKTRSLFEGNEFLPIVASPSTTFSS